MPGKLKNNAIQQSCAINRTATLREGYKMPIFCSCGIYAAINRTTSQRKGFITGFSLLELIIAVVVISIIGAVAFASFSSLSDKKLEAEAMKIISDISWVRERAVATHQHQAISFDSANQEYSIYKSPSGTSADFTSSNLLKKVKTEATLSLSGSNVWFYSPKGNASGIDTITLTINPKTKQIRIFPETGYTRSE